MSCISSPVSRVRLHWGMAASAIWALAVMPYLATSSAASDRLPSSDMKEMESPYRSRKASTASGCSSTNSLRATMQPMGRGVEETASHSALRSRAWRTPGSFISRAVAAGTGSMHTPSSAESMLAVTSWAVSHWMVTSAAGSSPFWVSR